MFTINQKRIDGMGFNYFARAKLDSADARVGFSLLRARPIENDVYTAAEVLEGRMAMPFLINKRENGFCMF